MTEAWTIEGKTCVVTGANTGLGRETAEALVKRGARVVLACRSEERTLPVVEELRRLGGKDQVRFHPLDLGTLARTAASARALREEEPAIHVLVNNAGLAGKQGATDDGFELCFGVNYLAPYLFTRLLLPALKNAAPARIVHVASRAHVRAKRIDWDAVRKPTKHLTTYPEYQVSKLGNVLFNRALAKRLEGTGVTTYAVHPGVVASDVWREIPWPLRQLAMLFMLSNEEGARTQIRCATDPSLSDESGLYYSDEARTAPSAVGQDDALAEELWSRSEAWVAAHLDD